MTPAGVGAAAEEGRSDDPLPCTCLVPASDQPPQPGCCAACRIRHLQQQLALVGSPANDDDADHGAFRQQLLALLRRDDLQGERLLAALELAQQALLQDDGDDTCAMLSFKDNASAWLQEGLLGALLTLPGGCAAPPGDLGLKLPAA